MNIPPYSRRSSSTPPSKPGSSERHDNQKPFQLPGRKENVQEKETKQEQMKKGLFDLTMEDAGVNAKQQELEQALDSAELAKQQEAVTQTTAIGQVQQIGQLIQKMVESMAIGEVGGKEFTSLHLKASSEVPQAFAGSQLTISYEQNGITIHFDNFMTPQQQNSAINLVEQNKEQLQQMVEALNAKNIQINSLSIGNHLVAVPRAEGLPAPFQPITTAETEPERGRDQRDHDEGNQKGQKE